MALPGLVVGGVMNGIGIPPGKKVAEDITSGIHDFLVGDTLTKKYTCNACGKSFKIKEKSGFSAK